MNADQELLNQTELSDTDFEVDEDFEVEIENVVGPNETRTTGV